MSLKDLTEELKKEGLDVTTKSLPPVGLDYRGRTKLERLLFLVIKEYCRKHFAYEIGGVSYTHQKCFHEAAAEHLWDPDRIAVVKEGFRLCDFIREVASSDPYVVDARLNESGGTVANLLRSLGTEIRVFAARVEKA
jgi:hypothetical protein